MYGTSNFVGTPHYYLISIIKEQIAAHKVIGLEVSHNQFGKGFITGMELQKNYLWFKYTEDHKKLSMDFFKLDSEDQLKINSKIALV